jgi:signal transduction histidine kinase
MPALQKRITFDVSGGPAMVRADPAGLRQVFANVFDNAIRYTPEGGRVMVGIKPSAEARAGKPGWVEIEVRDNGSGIPHDSLQRIFERFYRVDPARSRAEGGTGLGLSIVKHLVERMAGDVEAESEIGKGTTIRIRLPAAA